MTESEGKRPVVQVYVCSDDSEAEVVVSLLREFDIEAFRSSDLSHDVFPVTAGELGEVAVYVDEDNAESAIEIIEKRLSADTESSEEE